MLEAIFIGDRSRSEFRQAFESLAESTRLTCHASVDAATTALAQSSADPALAVIAVTYPGQFVAGDIALLRQTVPLTRIVALLGTWCEGETRNGRPWPANARVFWYHWPRWWRRAHARLTPGRPARWEMPPTATGQDRVLAAIPVTADHRRPGGLIAIAAGDWATYAAMAAAMESAGYATVWSRVHRPSVWHGTTGGIWDGGQLDNREQARLSAFCRRLEPAPVVALFDFPRVETVATAEALRVAAVFGKPYAVDELADAFGHAVRSRLPPIQVARSA